MNFLILILIVNFYNFQQTTSTLTCAVSYLKDGVILIDDANCTDADLCFLSASSDATSNLRRGCISGYKYFPSATKCYYDPNAFRTITDDETHQDGYFCVCNTPMCNEKMPLLNVSNTSLTISLGNVSFPSIKMPILNCSAYSTNYTYNGKESKLKFWSNTSHIVTDTACSLWADLEQANSTSVKFLRADVFAGRTWDTSSLFSVFYADSRYAPFYFGLLTSYQYFLQHRYYSLTCDYDNCNDNISLNRLATNQTIKCYLGYWNVTANPDTCMGHFCFFVDYQETIGLNSDYERGCLSQDYSKASGRIEVGVMRLSSTHYICAEDMCNKDQQSAQESINRYTPEMPSFVPYRPSQSSSPNSTTVDSSSESTTAPTTASPITVTTQDNTETTTKFSMKRFFYLYLLIASIFL